MFKLCYFVPESHLSVTKQALFEAGAGKIGDYEHCAWQCKGQGQFRPLEGSNPFLGQRGELEMVAENGESICLAMPGSCGRHRRDSCNLP